ncbi:MAG: methyltransferase domain-containing protein [Calditrichaeota bacterium]|nr:methyltransferase domain-containing protein [Calditrichota bacterium]
MNSRPTGSAFPVMGEEDSTSVNTRSAVEVFDSKSYTRFCDLVYDQCGILLNEKKRSLVEARLGKRLRQLNLDSLKSYITLLEHGEGREEMVQMLNLISTNVTSFFRENEHFNLLHRLVDDWAGQGVKRLRIWCAAASTGEEPWSLAMVIQEAAAGRIADIKLLGTDISTRVLEQCQRAEYEDRKLEPVSTARRERWFQRVAAANGEVHWRVRDELRRLALFRRLNLVRTPYPMKGPLDVIFCRNVMIYFDNPTRKRLMENMEQLLRPGGYLFVGHSESLAGSLSSLQRVAPSVYRRETP